MTFCDKYGVMIATFAGKSLKGEIKFLDIPNASAADDPRPRHLSIGDELSKKGWRERKVYRSFIFVETAPHRQAGSNNSLGRHGRLQTIVISLEGLRHAIMRLKILLWKSKSSIPYIITNHPDAKI
jgi:hypothetical protein